MPRCNLTLKQKAQLIELSKELSTEQLAKKFRVHTTTVTRTIRKKDRILQQASRVNPNFKTVQTNLRSEEHDSMMLEYIKNQQEANRPISVSEICDKAVECAEALGREIKSQRAWWRRFKIRCNVVKSKITREEKPKSPKKNKKTKNTTTTVTTTKTEHVEDTPAASRQIEIDISGVVDLLKETVRVETENDPNNKTNSVIIGPDGEPIESGSMESAIVEMESSDVVPANGLTNDVAMDVDGGDKVDDQPVGANTDLTPANSKPRASGGSSSSSSKKDSPTGKTRGRPRKPNKASPKKTSKKPYNRTAKTGKAAANKKRTTKKTDNSPVIIDNKNFTFKVKEPVAKTHDSNKSSEDAPVDTNEV